MSEPSGPSSVSVSTPIPLGAAVPEWYPALLDRVSGRIVGGHRRAVAAANTELIATYWAIGRDILDRQEREGYGTKVIDRLSRDLRDRFPGLKGFSPRNLKYMRSFAAAWTQPEVVQAPLAQLSWYHHVMLLDKAQSPELRLWYAAAAASHGWSGRFLGAQIDLRFHERAGKAVTNFAATLPGPNAQLAQDATRDPYLFDFLGATDLANERAVESALIDHVTQFLLELGQGFAFVGRQVRLDIGGDEFFCDLLFYHLTLRRYVVIELKAVPFEAAFLGQLGMYIAAVDDLLATTADGSTVGLLLCQSKNNLVAEYALRSMAAPIGIADWTEAITTSLPTDLTGALPTIEELEAELGSLQGDK